MKIGIKMDKQAKKWDEKAKSYNRYSSDEDRFEAKLLQKILAKEISFQNKRIIDIGAGTGVYTIRVAQDAKEVLALDFSSEMLEILKKDALTLGLQNISIQQTSWDAFKYSNTFDIALCTMSPALESDEDFQKFHDIATTKIYLGWAGIRDSNILNNLFKAHGKINRAPNGSAKLKNWLDKKRKFYMVEPIEELRVSTCKAEDGEAKYKWHLEIRGVEANENIIKDVLQNFTKDGIITETTTSHMNLIIW